MEWTYPKRLQEGMTIGFLSLGSKSPWNHGVLAQLEALCKVRGYAVLIDQSLQQQSDMDDVKRAERLQYMMTTAPCDAVIVLDDIEDFQFLEHLDYKSIRSYGKGFVGHGRCTAIHLAIHKYSGLVTYYGPLGIELIKANRDTVDILFTALEGKLRVIEPLPEPPRGAIGTELGSGTLIGGHMETLSQLQDTRFGLESLMLGTVYSCTSQVEDSQIANRTLEATCASDTHVNDRILLLEGEAWGDNQIDTILKSWHESKLLDMIAGVVVGLSFNDQRDLQNTQPEDTEGEDYDVGYATLRYMEDNRSFDREAPFVCYVSTSNNRVRHTLPLGADIHFRYISNTIVISPYTKG